MRISDWSSDVCSSDLAAGAAPHARPSPLAPVRHIPSTGGRTPRPQDRIWPYWPELHPAVPLWRESCRRISASVPAQPLGDSVDGDHFLLSPLYVLHSALDPPQFVIAYYHGKLRNACIRPLPAFLPIHSSDGGVGQEV